MKSIHRRGTHFLKSCSLSPNDKLQSTSWQIISYISFSFPKGVIRMRYLWHISTVQVDTDGLDTTQGRSVHLTWLMMTKLSIVSLYLLCSILNSDTLWLYCAQCKYCDHKPKIRKSVGTHWAIKGLSNKSCNRKM